MDVQITPFSMADYDETARFWAATPEVGLDDADSPESMTVFLARNPHTSFVARHEGKIDLVVEGVEKTYTKGDRYFIPAGAKHSAKVYAGYADVTFFNEPDRWKARLAP